MSLIHESATTLEPSSLHEPADVAAAVGHGAEAARLSAPQSALGALLPYLAIARPDHWCKNVFMALGVVLAYFCHPEGFGLGALAAVLWAVATTCLVASSNYVLNEILDAPTDLSHPVKRYRPI